MRVLVLLSFAAVCLCQTGNARGEQWFFRVLSKTNAFVASLDPHGMLSWSHTNPIGEYLIERSNLLTPSEWKPYTRGYASNTAISVKVHEFSPPAGMAFIPGGQFTMGDILGDLTGNNATPVHQAVVSPFFMSIHEVSNQELRDAFQWAYDQGLIVITNNICTIANGTNVLLRLGNANQGQEVKFTNGVFSITTGRSNYPCAFVTWYGAVAYCNFRGSMEGRELSYDLTQWTCDFAKTGYRLPTETEWEIAARGGYEAMRFPWGDTNVISHARANYKSSTNHVYDVSPTSGYHPDYGTFSPKSSPAGSFEPNAYGLHDMAGNIYEWVWDWWARYPSAAQYDPTGPSGPVNGEWKIFRGGSWYTTPERVIVAARYYSTRPWESVQDVGFRIALTYKP